MESKRVVTLVTMVTVMVMGNLLVQTEAQASAFATCYPGCLFGCAASKQFPQLLTCPFSCLVTCLSPPSPPIDDPSPPSQMVMEANEIDHTAYYCRLGCATHRCLSLSSVQNPNVDKVSGCVDSCSDMCFNKN